MLSSGSKIEIVLVGGGHAHVQVLRRLAMIPVPGLRVTVVLDTPVAVYSGMVPGYVAGQYEARELEIDVVPLARRAGARVILSAAIRVEAAQSRVCFEDRPPISYDFASLDVGSTVDGLDLPGVREHALPSRPISRFVERVGEELSRRERGGSKASVRLAVVGGGVGGVEVAFTLQERLERAGQAVETTLVHGGDRILPGAPAPLVRRALRHALERGIEVRCGTSISEVRADGLSTSDGAEIAADLVAWVTGAVGAPVLASGDLPLEDRGFVRTRSTLQVVGFDNLFAVGDCATLDDYPRTPKAGVYAVRQGPFLTDNLIAVAHGGGLRSYRPQADFLTLLNLGDGTALGSKWGRSFEGRWVFGLKDRIDRSFMDRFQVLGKGGAARREFPEMSSDAPMLCGGCAAKLGQSPLERALARLPQGGAENDSDVVIGMRDVDDAAAYRTSSGVLVASSVDLFPAFTDDSYLVGRVAAFNALSDLLATGVLPRHAMAVVAVPEDAPPDDGEEILFQCLAGMRSALEETGVALLGGHTTTAAKLMAGLAVDGTAEEGELLRMSGLSPDQRLILTKALGTGVVFHADMLGLLPGPWLQAALVAVQRSNLEALAIVRRFGGSGVTDVTGFGLAGHLGEMLSASDVSAVISLSALPALPGALRLLERGVRSSFHEQNDEQRHRLSISPGVDRSRVPLLFDPQTAGGLLFGVAADRVEPALAALHEAGDPDAAMVGEVGESRLDGVRLEVGS